MKQKLIPLLLLLFTINALSQKLQPKEGYIQVQGGRVWYKIVGSGNKTPLLFIHGGPGGSACSAIDAHTYLSDERPVVFYDQLGGGRSDRPTDTSLWRVDRFVAEVETLRTALDLKELHIIGHSWGSAILLEYLITKQPQGIQSAIFCGPLFSTAHWLQDTKILIEQLPVPLRDSLNKYEAMRKFDTQAYIAASDSFYARHLTVSQWPLAKIPACESVPPYNFEPFLYMWGPTEFTVTGVLKNYDRVNWLSKVKQPVLLIAGQYDEARPESMNAYHKLIAKSKLAIIEKAGHLVMIDQPVAYSTAIRNFLKQVEIDTIKSLQ